MNNTILPQSLQVVDLLNEIRYRSPQLPYDQRDALIQLVQQGRADEAADLLAAWGAGDSTDGGLSP